MSHRQGMSYFHYDLETHKETQKTQDSQGRPVQNNSNNNNNNNDDDYHTGITIPNLKFDNTDIIIKHHSSSTKPDMKTDEMN